MRRSSIVICGSALSVAFGGLLFSACGRDAEAMSPEKLERQYGVQGAYDGSVATPDGSIKGTVVPVTLADGRKAQLVIPAQRAKDPHALYMHDGSSVRPVEVSEKATRDDVAKSPAVVATRPDHSHASQRSWEKEALIVGGSAGAGTLIGAVAGGGKGAAIGGAAGGIGGLIYDLATRDKNRD